MLLARLLGWIKAHHTFRIFVLEVVAVFIGISASLIVDDWRQSRVDREILENLLQEIHSNAIVGQGSLELSLYWNGQALASTILLSRDDGDALSDHDILRHALRATQLAKPSLPQHSFSVKSY